ncbi:hypothetical protein ABEV55_14715 [Aneurinibacillus thermoaerophilus]|uniref:hypothetical protein n=1 Tax=Aneurinibacillus thermoaerophilus TaxID=143495 RepID=UPI002E1AB90B|nr:hypothetical protein [Aneurinibacillus thermoaerophilus]
MFELNTKAPTTFRGFKSEAERLAKLKEWGLISSEEEKPREFLLYQGEVTQGEPFICKVVGYTEDQRVVIEFPGAFYHTISPSSLRDMQRIAL